MQPFDAVCELFVAMNQEAAGVPRAHFGRGSVPQDGHLASPRFPPLFAGELIGVELLRTRPDLIEVSSGVPQGVTH